VLEFEDILRGGNLAEQLNADQLQIIGDQVHEHYSDDRVSREDWEDGYSKWLDMACQKKTTKNKPFANCANIKYPLVTQAALAFNARATPALIPNSEPVGAAPVGPDPDGQKTAVARIISAHMNHQLITEMSEWEEEMDGLLMSMSISGMEFKKTYYDNKKKRNVSRHVTPLQLVINYWAVDIESARKTEILKWSKNQLVEKINSGAFVDIAWDDLDDPTNSSDTGAEEDNKDRLGLAPPARIDSATPYVVLEYHGYYDLDGDGYEEPYIITILEHDHTVLQITPRFTVDNVEFTESGDVIAITPLESYTKYGFIPNPDGSFYHIGFGHILYPLNVAVNTAINQTLDNGTLNNTNSGFLGRGAKVKGGMFSMSAGKWLHVNASGDDLRKSIVPMPKNPVSPALMNLISFLVESGQKLSSTTDIMSGQAPGQNSKTGVVQAVRDEGQKVFTAIYKRARRSLKSELDKLFSLNSIVLNSGYQTRIHASSEIFGATADLYGNTQFNIQPSADPNIAIKEQKLQKDMMVMQTIQQVGMGDLSVAVRNLFVTMEVEDVDKLLPQDAQPQQDPKMAIEQMKMQAAQEKLKMEADMKIADMELDKNIAMEEIRIKEMKVKVDLLNASANADVQGAQIDVAVRKIDVENRKVDAMAQKPPPQQGVEQQEAIADGNNTRDRNI
jgi:chaperonin GroES